MGTLQDLINDGNPFISELATKAADIRAALDAEQISENEYVELMDDLLDLRKVNEAACTIEEKIAIQQAIETIKIIVGIVKGVL